MKRIEFPESVPLSLLRRLVVLGIAVALLGLGALVTDPLWLRQALSEREGSLVLSIVLLAVGVGLSAIGALGLLLQSQRRLVSLNLYRAGVPVAVAEELSR